MPLLLRKKGDEKILSSDRKTETCPRMAPCKESDIDPERRYAVFRQESLVDL